MAKKIIQLFLNCLLFLLGSLAILVVAYQFGWPLLSGQLNWGNDTPYALSLVYYLERWAPYLPRWHYEWAGGMPFLKSYPALMTYLTSFTHRLSGLSIVQTTKLFSWLAFPLAGVGIMVFGRLILKNWLLGILAGLFFLASPDAWLWIMFGGFYAATGSFPLMVASFVFFELGWQTERRIWWLLAVVFGGLTWLAHPVTGVSLTIGLGIYGLGRGWLKKKALLGIGRSILIGVGGFLLAGFWTIVFVLSRPGGVGVAAKQVVYVTLREIAGLVPAVGGSDYITSVFFSGAVWVLALLGVLLALIRKNKRVWILIAICLVGLFFMIGPGIFPWLLQGSLLTLWSVLNVRAVVLPRMMVPIIAAYGVVSLGESPFWAIAGFIKSLKNNLVWRGLTGVVGGILALGIVYLAFTKIVILPANHAPEFFYPGYGPVYYWLYPQKIDGQWRINDGKEAMYPSVEESLKRLLSLDLRIDDVEVRGAGHFPELVEKTGLDSHDRIDVSPLTGSVIAAWNATTDVSLIPPYLGAEASLMRLMIGYEQACFHNFSEHFECLKEEIKSLAKWWGVKLVYIGDAVRVGEELKIDEKPLANLKLAGFEEKVVELDSGRKILVYKIPETTELATLSNKPMALIIGDNPPHSDGYDTVFRSLNRVGFGYDRLIPVRGARLIDDYSLEELQQYPLVMLYGYQVKNRARVWSMLTEYVEKGGSLLVDTGWQYWSQDWGKVDEDGQSLAIEMPELLPVKKVKWGNIGTRWQSLEVNSNELGRKISNRDWADLTWEGSPWGMSLAEVGDLQDSAQLLMTAAGKIVVAGRRVGKGRVIWSGMNLFGHTSYNESRSENEFFEAVLTWLNPGSNIREVELGFDRITPDEVVVRVDKTISGERKVMFKEAMAPGWQVMANEGGREKELSILKVGPGWKLVRLPSEFETGELRFVYKKTVREKFLIGVSMVTSLALIAYLVSGGAIDRRLGKLVVVRKLKGLFSGRAWSLKEFWNDEET